MIVYEKPQPQFEYLNPLVGTWITTGEITDDSIHCPEKIRGTDIFEWVCEGFYLLHRVNVMIGKQHVEAIELIGQYNPVTRKFQMHSFDNEGKLVIMESTILPDGNLSITGNRMRTTLMIDEQCQQMTAHWERTEDTVNWKKWMNMTFTKVRE